jgi:hypothetical protein
MLWMVLAMRVRPPRRQHRPTGRRSQDQAAPQEALWNSWGRSHHGREREDADLHPDDADHLDLDRLNGQLLTEPIRLDEILDPVIERDPAADPRGV